MHLPLNRRTIPLVAAAVVFGSAGSAMALNGRLGSSPASSEPAAPPTWVTFSEVEPAPRGTLDGMDDGAPAGMESGVIADQARRIMEVELADGQTDVLFVAPTRKGGFCLAWSHQGGCWADRTLYERKRLLIGGGHSGSPRMATRVTGEVIAPGTHSVDVVYEDGAKETVRLVWVSEPINAGFFSHNVPAERRESGRRPVAVIARGGSGKEIARSEWSYQG